MSADRRFTTDENRRFTTQRDVVISAIVEQVAVPGSKIAVVSSTLQNDRQNRREILNALAPADFAMNGISHTTFKNGSRIFFSVASNMSWMGKRFDFVVIDRALHLNAVNTAAFMFNCMNVSKNVMCTDSILNDNIKLLTRLDFEV